MELLSLKLRANYSLGMEIWVNKNCTIFFTTNKNKEIDIMSSNKLGQQQHFFSIYPTEITQQNLKSR